MFKNISEKWFRKDNWSLSVAKIVAILWIPASFVGAYFAVKPHDPQTWIITMLLEMLFVFVGVILGFIILIANWKIH